MIKSILRKILAAGLLPPNFLLPVAIAGIIIIVVSVFIEYQSRRDDYIQMLKNQANLFIETLVNTAGNVLTAANELEGEITRNMIANLQLIGELDKSSHLSSERLRELLRMTQLDELHLYDSEGVRTAYAVKSTKMHESIPTDLIIAVSERTLDELIVALSDTVTGEKDYIAAIIRREDGGVLAGIITTERIQSFRQLFGFGRFLQRFQMGEGVEYIVLENPETIIAGIFEGYEISSFAEDSFLVQVMTENKIKTRTLYYGANSIFEAAAPFSTTEVSLGVLRIGLSMQEYEQFTTRIKRRMAILAAVVFIFCFIFLSFFISYRHRQLLRDELIRLQEYTNIILSNLGSGVIAVGKDGNIQVANKQSALILNLDASRIIGLSYNALPEFFTEIVKKGLQENKEFLQPQLHWFTSNDTTKRLSIKSTVLIQNEEPDTCILLVEDVTEQTRLEEQVRRQEKLSAMGKLASTVAHEIRNPLNSINLIVQLLDKKYRPKENVKKYQEYVSTVSGEISRISSIVNQFIRFARPPELRLVQIDFIDFFKDIEVLFRIRMEEHQIRFPVAMEEHPAFYGDNEQLKQVFVNLIENAIQAITPPGTITVKGKNLNNIYEIVIEDTGCGISEGNRKHIFDLYFTTKPKGTGVGLAVVQQIVSRHCGLIDLRSRVGKGTTFILRFSLQ